MNKKSNEKNRNNFIVLILICFIVAIFFAGMRFGQHLYTPELCVDKEKLIAKGKEYLAQNALSEKTYSCEILQIAYQPTEQEMFLDTKEIEGKEDILREERKSKGYILMYVDWYESHREQSFRKYFMISTVDGKDVIDSSCDIPLADGTVSALQNLGACHAAQKSLRKYLESQNSVDSIVKCEVNEEETKEMIKYYAATKEAMLRGWTKEFLENRFLVFTVVQKLDDVESKKMIVTRDIRTDEWVFQMEY